ncbi:MAG: tetratricopeptide repeat protein [Alistipes sp.]|nr:tetratricopeptide repeat protein [Alistipes sp.]
MRRLLTLLTFVCLIVLPQISEAQTQQQQVVVKTRGRIYANDNYRPGVRVPEAYVKVRGDKSYESDTRGEIKFGVSSQGYTIEEIKKTGYTLSDADILFREQKYTSAPLYILLENSADLVAYRREIERQVRRNYQATLDVKQAEIERLRSEGKATAEELERLQAEIDRSWDLAEQYVDEMTEHYLLIDFDNKEKFDQEVSTYILAGELEKADSLIATRGDLNEANRKHRNAKAAMKNRDEDLASRNYYKYQIASQRHERDSAAYWLEQRASLDRENVDWQVEAARYIEDFLGNYDRALNIYEPTLEYCKEHYGELHEKTATLYNNIGVVYKNKGEYDNALEYYKKAREIMEKVLDPQHPDLAMTYNNIGLVYDNKGEYDNALVYYNKAREIDEKVLDPLHPDLAMTYNNIGAAYYGKGQYDNALEYLNKVREIDEKVLAPQHPDLATTYNNIGAVYDSKGEYDNALEYYIKAKKIDEKVLDPQHPSLATTYNNIGLVYSNKGEYDNALDYHNKALEIREKVLDPQHPSLATTYNNIGLVYSNKGEYDNALEYYNKAREIQEKVLDPQHPDLAITYVNIAGTYRDKGEFDICLEYLEKALEIFEKSNHPYAQTVKTKIEETKAQMEKQ